MAEHDCDNGHRYVLGRDECIYCGHWVSEADVDVDDEDDLCDSSHDVWVPEIASQGRKTRCVPCRCARPCNHEGPHIDYVMDYAWNDAGVTIRASKMSKPAWRGKAKSDAAKEVLG